MYKLSSRRKLAPTSPLDRLPDALLVEILGRLSLHDAFETGKLALVSRRFCAAVRTVVFPELRLPASIGAHPGEPAFFEACVRSWLTRVEIGALLGVRRVSLVLACDSFYSSGSDAARRARRAAVVRAGAGGCLLLAGLAGHLEGAELGAFGGVWPHEDLQRDAGLDPDALRPRLPSLGALAAALVAALERAPRLRSLALLGPLASAACLLPGDALAALLARLPALRELALAPSQLCTPPEAVAALAAALPSLSALALPAASPASVAAVARFPRLQELRLSLHLSLRPGGPSAEPLEGLSALAAGPAAPRLLSLALRGFDEAPSPPLPPDVLPSLPRFSSLEALDLCLDEGSAGRVACLAPLPLRRLALRLLAGPALAEAAAALLEGSFPRLAVLDLELRALSVEEAAGLASVAGPLERVEVDHIFAGPEPYAALARLAERRPRPALVAHARPGLPEASLRAALAAWGDAAVAVRPVR
eukprot:tig00000889_g5324.t1